MAEKKTPKPDVKVCTTGGQHVMAEGKCINRGCKFELSKPNKKGAS